MNGFLLLQEDSEAALCRALGSSLTEGFFFVILKRLRRWLA